MHCVLDAGSPAELLDSSASSVGSTSPAWATLFDNTPVTVGSNDAAGAQGQSQESSSTVGSPPVISSVMEHLNAAIAAVEQTDVLTDDLQDFHAGVLTGYTNAPTLDTIMSLHFIHQCP